MNNAQFILANIYHNFELGERMITELQSGYIELEEKQLCGCVKNTRYEVMGFHDNYRKQPQIKYERWPYLSKLCKTHSGNTVEDKKNTRYKEIYNLLTSITLDQEETLKLIDIVRSRNRR